MSENQRIEFGHLPVEERIKSFRDFTIPLNDDEVHAQSLRCLHCGTPFCSNNCPLHNRPVDWNRLVREGDWERAWACLSATNSFPEFTSRVCPAICEAGCTRYLLDDAAVGIRSIERAVIDRAWREGWVRPEPAAVRTGRRVAVVGSGPAALPAPSSLPVRATTSRSTRSPSAPAVFFASAFRASSSRRTSSSAASASLRPKASGSSSPWSWATGSSRRACTTPPSGA